MVSRVVLAEVGTELMTASPAPSNASSVGPKSHHPPITYGQSQQLKKKKKTNRIMDSDDERERGESQTASHDMRACADSSTRSFYYTCNVSASTPNDVWTEGETTDAIETTACGPVTCSIDCCIRNRPPGLVSPCSGISTARTASSGRSETSETGTEAPSRRRRRFQQHQSALPNSLYDILDIHRTVPQGDTRRRSGNVGVQGGCAGDVRYTAAREALHGDLGRGRRAGIGQYAEDQCAEHAQWAYGYAALDAEYGFER